MCAVYAPLLVSYSSPTGQKYEDTIHLPKLGLTCLCPGFIPSTESERGAKSLGTVRSWIYRRYNMQYILCGTSKPSAVPTLCEHHQIFNNPNHRDAQPKPLSMAHSERKELPKSLAPGGGIRGAAEAEKHVRVRVAFRPLFVVRASGSWVGPARHVVAW